VQTLSPHIRDLVLAVTKNGERYVGETDKDREEVSGWIEKTSAGEVASNAKFQEWNSLLVSKTYLVSNYLTAADIALYGALHSSISTLEPQQHYAHPALTRYFDHVQSRPQVRGSAASITPPFELVVFDLENAPKIERKAEPPKKKEKNPAQNAETSRPPAAVPTGKTESPADKVPEKKEKKEKKPKEAAEGSTKKKGANAAAKALEPEDAGEPVPSMIDLRVGRIVDVMKHPDADSLYVEQVDLGEETGPRTVVSGLVKYIPIEEMRDRYLVAVCNLKPASMRGVKSFAMVLCATSKDGKEGGIEIIQPPPNAKPGDRVYFEGAEYENATPLSQLNPKKKIFETIQPGFITLDTREAAWTNPITKSVHRIRTQDGVCMAPTLVGASLS